MRIVLCHNCWSWVQLDGDRCPDCHQGVDLSDPDPSPAELDELFGLVLCRLASVRCDRRKLPSVGVLWGVAEGLLFLPELTLLPNGAMLAEESPAAHFWEIARWWSPWGRRAASSTTCELHADAVTDFAAVSERFLNAPGAVFVPRAHLIRASLRGRAWTISRSIGRTLRFTTIDSVEDARQSWREMLTRDPAWRQLTTVG